MVAVNSTMLQLGRTIPEFALKNAVTGETYDITQAPEAKGYLIFFICNHCPFVKHLHPELAAVCKQMQDKGFEVVGISSNDVDQFPEDGPDLMASEAKAQNYSFPYLFDDKQAVAKAFKAACTPDFYIFNSKRELAYRGQFDDSRPGNDLPVTGESLLWAAESILNQQVPDPAQQKPSIGCNIKWKKGLEPEYFNA